ncbi:unnamed protein product, partial [Prorocentrum cordatum]
LEARGPARPLASPLSRSRPAARRRRPAPSRPPRERGVYDDAAPPRAPAGPRPGRPAWRGLVRRPPRRIPAVPAHAPAAAARVRAGPPPPYPLMQPIWDHGYEWEHWALLPAGCFHTVYYGDFAQDRDYPPYWAWLQKYPMWVVTPWLVLWSLVTMVIFQNAGSVGIRPKRYTVEWLQATKERERIENTNPVTRYLDRRRTERGGTWTDRAVQPAVAPVLDGMWMSNTHDPDFPEYNVPGTPFWGMATGLSKEDTFRMEKTFRMDEERSEACAAPPVAGGRVSAPPPLGRLVCNHCAPLGLPPFAPASLPSPPLGWAHALGTPSLRRLARSMAAHGSFFALPARLRLRVPKTAPCMRS